MSSKPAEYLQVSAPGQTWGKGLSVPEQALCPFSNPKGVSEGDVVEIVDFIRELQSKGPVVREGDNWTWVGEKDAPIDSIHTEEGRDIEVWTGPTQHHIGGVFRIVKKEGKWTLMSTGSWVS